MQGLVEAAERARHEQEKGSRRQANQAREVQASVKSLSGKTGTSEIIATPHSDRQTDIQTDMQTDRQIGRQTDMVTHMYLFFCLCMNTAQLEQELAEREEKIGELHHALEMLDKDHDALRAEADGKDECIAQLRKQLSEKVRAERRSERRERRGGREIGLSHEYPNTVIKFS